MARLIARTLRLDRPALMQTGSSVSKYCLSYLMPILLGDWSVIIVAPSATQQYLLVEIAKLQEWLGSDKKVRSGNCWQQGDRLLLTTPQNWLSDRLESQAKFPPNIPTIIERADNLEEWTRNLLTIRLDASDWDNLIRASPDYQDLIADTSIKLTQSILTRPQNPYGNHTLLQSELGLISYLCQTLADKQRLTGKFQEFWHQISQKHTISWISRPPTGYKQSAIVPEWFAIDVAPGEVRNYLQPIWKDQPVVILGGFLDIESTAATYKQRLGLDRDILSLKFTPHRQNNHIQLYLPDRLPLPNTPDFQSALIEQSLLLVSLSSKIKELIVLISDDVPLQGKVGSALAAEFGSRVKVETAKVNDDGILICSWSFWQQHQENLPIPRLLIVATLPIPSLENPLIANRVAYYKNRRKDWFRLYLLPTALKTLEQTVVPLRESQSIIALLDNRVNSRSYGKAILSTLEPFARINYIDPTWFGYPNS
ncbi:ATP-dependent DNA helicase [Waterburya agarophytonicola K14]|uniref:ATP-dependent DNA helicase n=2 Tax=Waterburya TaxID=2886915 RepID=A0A964BPQ4_9CYAN|nr:ATP-dependent DNA helicase [Waterburya agarophytonicola KI4]